MILLDEPYVSDLLLQRIREGEWPTVGTAKAHDLGLADGPHVAAEELASESLRRAHAKGRLKLYTNSENALDWVAEHLADTQIPALIDGFKNKARFRALTASLSPDYPCREVRYQDLDELDPHELAFPLILKPAVGFFSIGVRQIATAADWTPALDELHTELDGFRGVYPEQVLDVSTFVIEPYVEGREFAIDAYYDAAGEPVVLGLLEHVFSSQDDVGDRVYTTSAELVREHLDRFTNFLAEIGRLVGATDIPVHVELRITPDGDLFPIEVNPLRFGGWCTTADLNDFAFGIDSYRHYLEDLRPDWGEVLDGLDGRSYSVIVLNNSTGIEVEDITAFDHEAVAARFTRVLELRPIDHRDFRLFGFIFVETTPETRAELDWILHSDLREFVVQG